MSRCPGRPIAPVAHRGEQAGKPWESERCNAADAWCWLWEPSFRWWQQRGSTVDHGRSVFSPNIPPGVQGPGRPRSQTENWWQRWKRDYHRNQCWPEPFIAGDRQAVKVPFEIMADNAWQRQLLLSDYHFVDGTTELNDAGKRQAAVDHHAGAATAAEGLRRATCRARRQRTSGSPPCRGPWCVWPPTIRRFPSTARNWVRAIGRVRPPTRFSGTPPRRCPIRVCRRPRGRRSANDARRLRGGREQSLAGVVFDGGEPRRHRPTRKLARGRFVAGAASDSGGSQAVGA